MERLFGRYSPREIYIVEVDELEEWCLEPMDLEELPHRGARRRSRRPRGSKVGDPWF